MHALRTEHQAHCERMWQLRPRHSWGPHPRITMTLIIQHPIIRKWHVSIPYITTVLLPVYTDFYYTISGLPCAPEFDSLLGLVSMPGSTFMSMKPLHVGLKDKLFCQTRLLWSCHLRTQTKLHAYDHNDCNWSLFQSIDRPYCTCTYMHNLKLNHHLLLVYMGQG